MQKLRDLKGRGAKTNIYIERIKSSFNFWSLYKLWKSSRFKIGNLINNPFWINDRFISCKIFVGTLSLR